MKKLKKIIPIIITFIIGISTTVGATTIFNSKDITYSSDKTSKTNVKEALDELYSKASGSSSCEEISGGCDKVAKPNLGTNQLLVPIIIEDSGKVIKTSETDSNWYDYCNKKWANAVILSSNEEIKDGAEIPSNKINSYFVWIPKYKYKLWNVESTTKSTTALKGRHSIDIIFDTTDTIDEKGKSCKTPLTSGATLNCNNGEYMTHPAFITMGVDGFWVGKFEVGNLSTAVQIDGKNTNIRVVPGVESWRNINVKTMFDNSLNYSTTLNSHMMKNTEWGAVAYLSHSRFGIDNEININNNSSYLTGYSALLTTDQSDYLGEEGTDETKTLPYNTKTGYLATTTGNISGIYDMSGGAWEYTASYIRNNYSSSGFDASNISTYDSKYFDVYSASSESKTYQYRILGDATGEMGPFIDYKDGDGTVRPHNKWFGDFAYFVDSFSPWFYRGAMMVDGALASQFSFAMWKGEAYDITSFRLVLAP